MCTSWRNECVPPGSVSIVCMQVYGDDRVPMQQVISELVQPVIGGKVDMAMAEYSDKVCAVYDPLRWIMEMLKKEVFVALFAYLWRWLHTQLTLPLSLSLFLSLFSLQSSLLSLLSYPITGHLASVSNSTLFSLHTAVWQKGLTPPPPLKPTTCMSSVVIARLVLPLTLPSRLPRCVTDCLQS